jgi:pimeloyl-ACP methyl ester carboxylesterase
MTATLIFLPGTLCDDRVWAHAYRALSVDWKCVFVDYKFHTSIAEMAATALAQVKGTVIPIGISMGGIVALQIWRQAPERIAAMALFDTNPGADSPERRAARDELVLSANRGGFREIVESQLAPSYFSQKCDSNGVLRDTVVAMALDQGVGAFTAQATALATRTDAWDLLSHIHVPTLVACGENDRICAPDAQMRMAKLMPQSTFRTISAAGHLPFLEQPEATINTLRLWLNSLPAELKKSTS